MPSTIRIAFNGATTDGETLILKTGQPVGSDMIETFRNVRTAAYMTTVGPDVLAAFANYFQAISIDYNQLNLFDIVTPSIGVVEITHPNSGFFTLGEVTNTTANVDIDGIFDTTDATPVDIDLVTFSAATDICGDVQVNVTTSNLATIVNGPVVINPNAANPFNFEWLRDQTINIQVENATGETDNKWVDTPSRLLSSSITVNVINSPSGASVSAIVVGTGLTLEYSLDNILYQSENTYNNIALGDYTMYVRDQFGCVAQKDFSVADFETEGVGVLSPVADTPAKSNSILFKREEDFETVYKNDENTLTCESKYLLTPYSYIQPFRTRDVIRTQIRTNYETVTPIAVDRDGNETALPLNKLTENIGLTDSRDATIYAATAELTGIYFTSGNTYTYGTSTVIGSYILNGGLPAWATIGNYIFFSGAWHLIDTIIFDSAKSAEVIIINEVYSAAEATVQASSIYNAQTYEVYEFITDMNLFPDKFIRVGYEVTDTRIDFPDVRFVSEMIKVADTHKKMSEFRYYNDENSGNIMYNSGIQHIIHVPIALMHAIPFESSSSDKSDTTAYLVEAEVHEGTEIKMARVPRELMRKIVLASSHTELFIDDVGYVKEGEMNIEPVIGTDLYKIIGTYVKTGNVYSTQAVDAPATGAIEIPKLLVDNGEYIKYK